MGHSGPCTPERLSGRLGLPEAMLAQPLRELTEAGFVARAPQPGESEGDGHTGHQTLLALTPTGQQAHDRLLVAQRAELDHLLEGWSPDQEAELAALLTTMSQRLLDDDVSDRTVVAPLSQGAA
jgi:DNA-binding MarR family transcriptional regulator